MPQERKSVYIPETHAAILVKSSAACQTPPNLYRTQSFAEYAKNTRVEESIHFLLEIKKLEERIFTSEKDIKEIEDDKNYQEKFREIYVKFIDTSAQNPINIKAKIKSDLDQENAAHHFTLQSFVLAKDEIDKLIKAHTLPNYQDLQKKFSDALANIRYHLDRFLEKHKKAKCCCFCCKCLCFRSCNNKIIYKNIQELRSKLDNITLETVDAEAFITLLESKLKIHQKLSTPSSPTTQMLEGEIRALKGILKKIATPAPPPSPATFTASSANFHIREPGGEPTDLILTVAATAAAKASA